VAEVVTYGRGHKVCESLDFHCGADEILKLLGCDKMYARLLPMFWDGVSLFARVTYPPSTFKLVQQAIPKCQ
jgi:hypothetical protein